ncbi:MAG: alkaline phosphatase family protein [Saonia sp.]
MESTAGIWPCEQDNRMLSKGLITEKMWFDQAERLAAYYQGLILANIEKSDWDLLIGYFTLIDDVQHRYFLNDPRQLEYHMDEGKRKDLYNQYVEWAYSKVDKFLLEIIKKTDEEINVMIVSDHGMASVHSVLLINNYLSELGFNVNAKNAQVRGYSTGPAAHIYVNLKERNNGGIVDKSEFEPIIDTISNALKNLKDPETGEEIFKLVLKSSEMKPYGLYHPTNSGDIFVSANLGWSLSSKIVPELNSFIVPNAFKKDAYQHLNKNAQKFLLGGFMNETGLGIHGNLGNIREMHAIFYAIGPNIPNKRIGTIKAIDVAPTITKLLKIEPPKNAEGLDFLDY